MKIVVIILMCFLVACKKDEVKEDATINDGGVCADDVMIYDNVIDNQPNIGNWYLCNKADVEEVINVLKLLRAYTDRSGNDTEYVDSLLKKWSERLDVGIEQSHE